VCHQAKEKRETQKRPGGKGGIVKSRTQAIAIGLSEARKRGRNKRGRKKPEKATGKNRRKSKKTKTSHA
jgi:hypothetical protein